MKKRLFLNILVVFSVVAFPVTIFSQASKEVDLEVDGQIKGGRQGVANCFDCDVSYEPGTVVVIDPRADNKVTVTAKEYDKGVVGVICENPGLTLGVESGISCQKCQVCTSGNFKVKVDASSGAIKLGDFLVTSTKKGFARKSKPVLLVNQKIHTPGTILGTALEGLESGQGEILVSISLR